MYLQNTHFVASHPERQDSIGVVLQDEAPEGLGRTAEVHAPIVVNATGAWADDMRRQVKGESCLRKLRGSHLIFPARRLPPYRAGIDTMVWYT